MVKAAILQSLDVNPLKDSLVIICRVFKVSLNPSEPFRMLILSKLYTWSFIVEKHFSEM